MRFDDDTLFFGDAVAGDEVLAEYIFTNTGKRDLEIDIVSVCECIQAEWPHEKIAPGEAGLIRIVYDTRNRAGENKKTIDVVFKNLDTEGYPLVKQIFLEGRVIKK
ncbi:MAG: DUF1573 domain-containing protein [Saprospiraceae bacterium]|nr:DUF1573 domain-containing protein [Saprospiraceae bacterium]